MLYRSESMAATILKAYLSIFLYACSLLLLLFTLTQPQPTQANIHFKCKTRKVHGAFFTCLIIGYLAYHHQSGWSHRAGRWMSPSGSCPLQTRPPSTRSSLLSWGQKQSCSLAPFLWKKGQHPPDGEAEIEQTCYCETVKQSLGFIKYKCLHSWVSMYIIYTHSVVI